LAAGSEKTERGTRTKKGPPEIHHERLTGKHTRSALQVGGGEGNSGEVFSKEPITGKTRLGGKAKLGHAGRREPVNIERQPGLPVKGEDAHGIRQLRATRVKEKRERERSASDLLSPRQTDIWGKELR